RLLAVLRKRRANSRVSRDSTTGQYERSLASVPLNIPTDERRTRRYGWLGALAIAARPRPSKAPGVPPNP
ncbi:MAG: hypothetical protein KDA38_17895, partial [Planctomycetales bacterium]|nr:hypothetical protein [Planctomycetales bacterium]